MSLSSFADRVGVSIATIKRWEAGTSMPTKCQQESIFDASRSEPRTKTEPWRCHPGWWLRVFRHRSRLSIRSAADRSGISSSAWQRYENGVNLIGRKQSLELAGAICPSAVNLPQETVGEEALLLATEFANQDCGISAAILLHLILGLQANRDQLPESEIDSLACRAHAQFAGYAMQMGDHDLGGQAYRAAARLGSPEHIDPTALEQTRICSVWIGYPHIKSPELAASRAAWLDQRVAKVPGTRQSDFSVLRAMFADWSGHPDQAESLLDRGSVEANSSRSAAIAVLVSGWLMAKYEQPTKALSVVESWLRHEDHHLEFLATKVAFESFLQLGEIKRARDQFSVLQELQKVHGHWAPDLTARGRRLALD